MMIEEEEEVEVAVAVAFAARHASEAPSMWNPDQRQQPYQLQ